MASNGYNSNSHDDKIYAHIWNEIMNSPYQTTIVHGLQGFVPQGLVTLPSFIPLSPPSSPPTRSTMLPPAHPNLQNLGPVAVGPAAFQPVSPPHSASPPLSPVSPIESLSVHNYPFEDYTDGGRISNTLALPMMATLITHIDQSWARVFFHSWHFVFHMTHIYQPAPNLVQNANRALRSAYARWDMISPNDPLLPVSIIIEGEHLRAARRTDGSSAHNIPDIIRFENRFKAVIRLAREANTNWLLQCTLGALIVSQVVPFLPAPHADIRASWLANDTLIPRIYMLAQKNYLVESATWDPRFKCRIWHYFKGNRVLWFANQSVRDFLALLLSPNENSAYTLGARHLRRNHRDDILSWGPVTELDNSSVLTLLAKLLASLTISILYDAAQQPRQLPHDYSDTLCNSQVNIQAERTLRLLLVLDDVNVFDEYSHELVGDSQAWLEGHRGLLELKEFLGFM